MIPFGPEVVTDFRAFLFAPPFISNYLRKSFLPIVYMRMFTCWSAKNRERSCFSENVNVNKLIHDFSIFYLPHPGLFLFPSKKNKKISKTRGQLSKKFSNWVVEGHDPGHLENRISIHQIPSLYQEPEMQVRGDFLLLRNERQMPMHGKPDCHR